MKKCGSTTSTAPAASKPMDGCVEMINSLSIDTMTSVVQNNATDKCQHFSMRKYVADTREKNPKACNPFGENTDHIWEQLKGPLDVPQFKWWRCKNCVHDIVASIEHRASGRDATKGEGSKAPIEVINLDDSDDEGEIQETSPLLLLARVATQLKEQESAKGATTQTLQPTEERPSFSKGKEIISEVNDTVHSSRTADPSKNCYRGLPCGQANANHGQEFVRPMETEKAKRPNPFSPNTDLISRKRAKASTGPNHLVRTMYKNLEARYTREQSSPPSTVCIINKNPADFSVPGPQNNYMIGGEDL